MKETAIDVPWLKVFATGFKHGIKWGLASLLFELPILLGMLLGIMSKEQAIWMAWGISSLVAGLGCLLALIFIIAVAYMKHRWFRYLALMFIVLYFGSPVMLAIFLPYVAIYVFIAEPPGSAWGFCIAVSLYAFFLYWWSKIPIALFIKAKVHASIWRWIVKTANKDNRKRLKKFIREEL